eukprot:scaffold161102_cov19-Tisochrysis_lutea.AAC.2
MDDTESIEEEEASEESNASSESDAEARRVSENDASSESDAEGNGVRKCATPAGYYKLHIFLCTGQQVVFNDAKIITVIVRKASRRNSWLRGHFYAQAKHLITGEKSSRPSVKTTNC